MIEAAMCKVPVVGIQLLENYKAEESDWVWSHVDLKKVAERIVFLLKNEEERKNVVIPLPDIPVKNLQEMLARGLDHARLAKGNQPGLAGISPASGYQLSQDINAAYIRMRELDDHQLFLWKRLFEMEEGFAASVEEAKTIPGIHPW